MVRIGTKKISPNRKHCHTRKRRCSRICGEILEKKEGWTILRITGDAYNRGFAHGSLLHDELRRVTEIFPYTVKDYFHIEFDVYLQDCSRLFDKMIETECPELYEELRGISDGSLSRGVLVSVPYLIAWNAVLSMSSYYRNSDTYRCSAFIATGSATSDGDIIMGHNTHSDFITGKIQNIILYVHPSRGCNFVMQCAAGFIASGVDWFICASGIMGCETTISRINYVPEFGLPYFCRIRQAMQYGKTLDDYTRIMLEKNAGDYACSWLLGDYNTNEIMLFEIGLKHHAIQRTKDGVYYGMNTVLDNTLREQETSDTDLYNLKTSSGSRNHRLNYLLNIEYYGKITIDVAKTVLSDHYDSHLKRQILNSRSICKHSELDKKRKYSPFGCTDAKVTSTGMARNLEFMGIAGPCCGRVFNAKRHIKKHPRYKEISSILEDFPRTKWIHITKR